MARRKTWGWRAVELLVVSSFALAQPMYSLLGENATFFVAHRLSGAQLVAYALLLLLLPPAVLLAIEATVHLTHRRTAELVHVAFLGSLFTLAVIPPVGRSLDLNSRPTLVLFGLGALAAAVVLARWTVARRLIRYASFAPVLFLVSFLAFSPVSTLVWSQSTETAGVIPALEAPIVWLVLDQFPSAFLVDETGRLNEDRYPGFARLAEISTWYPRATAAAANTSLSVPAALSGDMPSRGQLPVASEHPRNVFTLLGARYDIVADEYVTQLCPDSLCDDGKRPAPSSVWRDSVVVAARLLLPRGVADQFVPTIDDRWNGFGDDNPDKLVSDEAADAADILDGRLAENDDRVRFANFLDELGATERPGLHYLHLNLPHEPLRFLPDGRSYAQDSAIGVDDDGRWPDQPEMMGQRLQQYVAQTMFADSLVGRLLDRLESIGLLDEALVVVMSDHGMSTLPGSSNRSVSDEATLSDILPIPLFIKAPGTTPGATNDRAAQLIDVLPTVLELLGVDPLELGFDGRSLIGDEFKRTPLVLTDSGIEELEPLPDPTESQTIPWIAAQLPVADDPFQFGEHAGLIGQPAASLVDGSSVLQAELVMADDLADVRPEGPFVPANVYGNLSDADGPTELAVAINGIIAGVGSSYESTGWRFSVLVDPIYFVPGRNMAAIYEIRGKTLASVRMSQ